MDADFVRDLVQAVARKERAAGMPTTVIAIDGPGGAGKSTLANILARQLRAEIVRTDEFASPDNSHDWWPELIEKVLEPIRQNEIARYRPSSWTGDGIEGDFLEVKPGEFLILEGVSSSRQAFRPFLGFSIWIETPRELRLRRGLERDGERAKDQWEKWMAEEDAYFAREDLREAADLVVPGDQDLWTL